MHTVLNIGREAFDVLTFGAGVTLLLPILFALPSRTLWGAVTGAATGFFVVLFIPLSAGVPVSRDAFNSGAAFALVAALTVYGIRRLYEWHHA